MQSQNALTQSKVAALTATLFNTRWRGERECTIADVMLAHKNLDLLDAPWPTRTTANNEVQAIQDQLDRITAAKEAE